MTGHAYKHLPLSAPTETQRLFEQIFRRELSDDEIEQVLLASAETGENSSDIVQVASALRSTLFRQFITPPNAMDVCGTGGDGSHSLNISTAVAIVVAACGVPVAKHGNRAASSLAGGADTLEALGLNIFCPQEKNEACLADIGIAFLYAPMYYPLLADLVPIRRKIAKRTILNMIGPLCNPAGVKRQLIGVADAKLLDTYAAVAQYAIGAPLEQSPEVSTRMILAHGVDEANGASLDELSISGDSDIRQFGIWSGERHRKITPEDAGLPRHPLAALKGGNAAYNAAALRRLLMSVQDTPQDRAYRDAVLLNCAAALIVADEVNNLSDGVEEAREVIDKGLAKTLLDCWISFCA